MNENQPCCRPTLPLPIFLLTLAVGVLIGLVISFTAGGPGQEAAQAAGSLHLKRIGNFQGPVYVTQPPKGGSVYVVERRGRVRIVRKGKTLARPLFDISGRVESGNLEQGLLSIAFAPDFRSSKRLYAYYTAKSGDQLVVEMRTNDRATRTVGTPREVLRMSDPGVSHNGGLLQFGPDGLLYIGTGDGTGPGDPLRTAQDPDSLLGKILRINPRPSGGNPYSSPSSNPFVGRAGLDEIFAYGLRNPWRFSFEPRRDLIAIGDVGQNEFEEVNVLARTAAKGGNFGWSAYEALSRFNLDQTAEDRIDPVVSYDHDNGCSVTGGYFVNDPDLPALRNRYLYADLCTTRIRSFRFSNGSVTGARTEDLSAGQVVSFGRGSKGQIWIASITGPVYRIKQG
jgi:glucose/arabinose dehydrogenase